jgi:hypothetical protein
MLHRFPFSAPVSQDADCRLKETTSFDNHFPRRRSLLLKKRFLSATYCVSKNIEITIMVKKASPECRHDGQKGG